VAFDIDANGIVNVSAKDQATGKEQSIRITASSGLSQEEIDRLVKDAESHADEDRRKRERIEARNQADSLVYQTEKTLQEHGANLDDATRSEVESAVADLKKAMEGDDVEEIKAKTDALNQASHKLAQAMYGQSAGPEQGHAQGGQQEYGQAGGRGDARSRQEEDVVDAEYEDVA
jgi:molecular chaperone DnaK